LTSELIRLDSRLTATTWPRPERSARAARREIPIVACSPVRTSTRATRPSPAPAQLARDAHQAADGLRDKS
jgi:hypothetical protein